MNPTTRNLTTDAGALLHFALIIVETRMNLTTDVDALLHFVLVTVVNVMIGNKNETHAATVGNAKRFGAMKMRKMMLVTVLMTE